MGPAAISFPVLVACSSLLLLDGCWAGPFTALHNLKDPRDAAVIIRRGSKFTESFPFLQPRSDVSGHSQHSSIWLVTAVVCIIILICLVIIAWVIVRRSKEQDQKLGSDEELGFGKHPNAQPDLMLPPKTYDGASIPYSMLVKKASQETIEDVPTTKQLPPPPALTISPPEEDSGSMSKRIPVPRHLISPRLIGLPPSPRLPALSTSSRPPSPQSDQSRDTHSQDLSESQGSIISPSSCSTSSPRRFTSSSFGAPTEMDYYYEESLSAGSLERMMTQMQRDLSEEKRDWGGRSTYSARV